MQLQTPAGSTFQKSAVGQKHQIFLGVVVWLYFFWQSASQRLRHVGAFWKGAGSLDHSNHLVLSQRQLLLREIQWLSWGCSEETSRCEMHTLGLLWMQPPQHARKNFILKLKRSHGSGRELLRCQNQRPVFYWIIEIGKCDCGFCNRNSLASFT